MATLIEYAGGTDMFIKRMDKFFEPGVYEDNEAFGSTIFIPSNEPSFTTPYLYNFVRRQHLTVKQSRYIAKTYYSLSPAGLPGNSDAGAMQSWVLWNMYLPSCFHLHRHNLAIANDASRIGLYPLTGQTTFLIGSPWFKQLSIDLGKAKRLNITSTGGDSDTAYYVQSLEVNGREWNKSWVTWSDIFENGGTMDFVLGPEPRDWATGELPPSPAS